MPRRIGRRLMGSGLLEALTYPHGVDGYVELVRPLLEQAEDAGLSPEYGCRMGICNTCSARKRSGRVRNILTGATSSAAEEQICICVSVPAGDVALDL